MKKKIRRRLGWVVLVGILVSAIMFFAIALISARTKAGVAQNELIVVRQELAEVKSALSEAQDEGQIQAFIRVSVVSYFEGDRKATVRFLEYAILLMAGRDHEHLGALPAKMLNDPLIARKLGLKKGSQKVSRRFGGG